MAMPRKKGNLTWIHDMASSHVMDSCLALMACWLLAKYHPKKKEKSAKKLSINLSPLSESEEMTITTQN